MASISSRTMWISPCGSAPNSRLVATRLGAVHWLACDSPTYLLNAACRKAWNLLPRTTASHSNGCTPPMSGRSERRWRPSPCPSGRAFAVNAADGAIGAVIAGAGIARILSHQAAEAMADGRLMVVPQAFQPEPLPVHLIHTGQAIMPLKLRAFAEFATPRLKDRLPSA
jgi:DNA-binding transcriptional LysR family regulator